jgi:hypothetical protein
MLVQLEVLKELLAHQVLQVLQDLQEQLGHLAQQDQVAQLEQLDQRVHLQLTLQRHQHHHHKATDGLIQILEKNMFTMAQYGLK